MLPQALTLASVEASAVGAASTPRECHWNKTCHGGASVDGTVVVSYGIMILTNTVYQQTYDSICIYIYTMHGWLVWFWQVVLSCHKPIHKPMTHRTVTCCHWSKSTTGKASHLARKSTIRREFAYWKMWILSCHGRLPANPTLHLSNEPPW